MVTAVKFLNGPWEGTSRVLPTGVDRHLVVRILRPHGEHEELVYEVFRKHGVAALRDTLQRLAVTERVVISREMELDAPQRVADILSRTVQRLVGDVVHRGGIASTVEVTTAMSEDSPFHTHTHDVRVTALGIKED